MPDHTRAGEKREVESIDTERTQRIDDGIRDCGQRAGRPGLACAFYAQRVGR